MFASETDNRAQASDQLAIRCLRGPEGLDEIYDGWLNLMKRIQAQSFCQHPAWFRAYVARKNSIAGDLEFWVAARNEQPIGVFPLLKRRSGPYRRASLPRDGGLYQSDFAIADGENKRDLWQTIRQALNQRRHSGWDVFSVPGEGALETATVVQCLDLDDNLTYSRPLPQQCMVIEVLPYETIRANLKSKFRNNLKRSERRLHEQGVAEFRRVNEPGQVEVAFQSLVDLELSGWKGQTTGGKAGYPNPSAIGLHEWKVTFYRNVVTEFARLGLAEIVLLDLDGKTIGAQLNILLNETCYLLKTTYDEHTSGFAPGHLMIDHLLRTAAESEQIKEINLISDYSWHSPWNPKTLSYLSLTEYRKSIIGIAAAARYQIARS